MTDDARYARALARLGALARFGMRPGLDAIAAVLDELGHPERAVPALHVAGTNGKGSTAAFAEAVLRAAGARVGLYTSPHLARFSERIRIDGAEIDRARCASLAERVLDAARDRLTFFEVATAMAFLAFAEARVEVAVVEVGLGGRLDATNLCAPFATVIASIGLDHTAELGDTTAAIAREKAGIAKAGVPLIVGPVDAGAEAAIADAAARAGATLLRWGRDLDGALADGGLRYRGPGGALDGAPLGLGGAHQARNAALALAATSFAPRPPSEAARRRGLAEVRWPARLERVAGDLLLDGAHNPDGAAALAAALAERATFVVGVLADKAADGVLAPLLPRAARVVCTTPPSPRALSAEALAARVRALAPTLPVEVVADPLAAVAAARGGGLVVACGSLYLVGALRAALLGEPRDPVAVADPVAAAKT